MSNGTNDYGVEYSRISFVDRILSTHENVLSFNRNQDIVFDIIRKSQGDAVRLICVDPYVASLELVIRIINDFRNPQIIFIGGNWNTFTIDAFEYCLERKIGIFNVKEINGAIHRRDYWNYEKFDSDGNSEKPCR